MGSQLQELVDLCRQTGAEVPRWTQGAGGNISHKANGRLLIKASGVRLEAVGPQRTIACLAHSPLVEALRELIAARKPLADADASYRDILAKACVGDFGQPSMEAGMHALLPGRDCLHLHALSAIVLAAQAQRSPQQVAQRLARHGLTYTFIPAVLPGWQLCQAVAEARPAPVLLLANHGLILQGDGRALLQAWREVEHELFAQWPTSASWAAADAMQGDWVTAPIWAAAKLPDVAVFWSRLLAISRPCEPPAAEVAASKVAPPHASTGALGADVVAKGGFASSPGQGQLGHLAPMQGSWRQLCRQKAASDRDAAELWAAMVALHEVAPQLPPLPSAYVASVVQMPQERWRQAATAVPAAGLAGCR